MPNPTARFSRKRRATLARCLTAAALAGAAVCTAPKLFAKHPTNAGPVDPPIKFKVPIPIPLRPEEALKTFKLPPGFHIEVAAADPMVQDPIAITFDPEGRMWVVEFRGYMHDINGGGQDKPTCRIKVLEDTKGDGHFDKATIFKDDLILPRAVLPTRGGALIAEPPELDFYKNDDGKAGDKTVIATNYGSRGGQPEHMANGLFPAMDNWIYNAAHAYRYRFLHGKWVAEPSPARGQWGVSQDQWGRLYYCDNSDLGRVDPLPAHYFLRNAWYHPTASQNVEMFHGGQPVWPSHMTPGTNRGYAGDLRPDGTLKSPTAACGNVNYLGGLFPPEFEGNYFVCEPAGNLVQRDILTESAGRISAKNAYDHSDFLTSTDERFRPVNLANGPDGALYVVDMYRGVLQETSYLTNYLIKNIEQRHLVDPIHWGRIYRIVPDGASPRPFKMPHDPAALVACLGNSNGWVRQMAQRMLVEKHDEDSIPPLESAVASAKSPLARLHALWTLDGMGKLDPQVALKALSDSEPQVRIAAIRLLEPLLVPATRMQALPAILKLSSDPSPDVQLQLALTLSAVPDAGSDQLVTELLTHSSAEPAMMRDAAISGLRGRELDFIEKLSALPAWSTASTDRSLTLAALAGCVMGEHHSAPVTRLLKITGDQGDGSWRQVALLQGMLPRGAKKTKGKSSGSASAQMAMMLGGVPIRLIYLDAEPPALKSLLESKNEKVRDMARQVNGRLAWPGKPGVPPPPKVIPLTPPQQALYDRGQIVFSQTCAACHQPTGLGQDGLAPPLVDSEWALGPEKRVIRIVLQGVSGSIGVEGVQYRLEMPPLTKLSDEDIAAALTYVRREKDWEHNASPVTPEAVKKVREEVKDHADPWTEKELQGIK